MQPGTELPATASSSNLAAHNGTLIYPNQGQPLVVPANGTVYLNVTATNCRLQGNAGNPLPNAVVLKKHYYFGFRPSRTWQYGEFDSRDWAAHIGMGNETTGFALAGEGGHATRCCVYMCVCVIERERVEA